MSLVNTKEFLEQNKEKKFYKITNKDETHHGFYFNDGLNVDTIPFNPTGTHQPGGIYFTDFEHFPHWTNYKKDLCWVRPVTLSEKFQVYIEESGCYKANKLILGERMSFYEFYESMSVTDVISHMKINGLLLKYVKNYQTDDICEVACAQNGRALRYVIDQTLQICMAAVKQNGEVLVNVKDQTTELCIAACSQDGSALRHVLEQTEKICRAACLNNRHAFRHVKIQTEDLCIFACTLNGHSLKYVENQTLKICKAAYENTKAAKRYMDEEFLEIIEDEEYQISDDESI